MEPLYRSTAVRLGVRRCLRPISLPVMRLPGKIACPILVGGLLFGPTGCGDSKGGSDEAADAGSTVGTAGDGGQGGGVGGAGGGASGGAAAAGGDGGTTVGSGGSGATGGGAGSPPTLDGETYSVSDLCFAATPENATGPVERDRSNGAEGPRDGGPITVEGIIYPRGLGVHAPSKALFDLAGNCSRFDVEVGIDDETRGLGSVVFRVLGDGEPLATSQLLTGGDAAESLSVDVTDVGQLELVVDDEGENAGDHAAWASARVICSAPPGGGDCSPPGPSVEPPMGYELVWADEFDGEGPPNPENWDFEAGFVRNEEHQWYQEDNAWQKGGFLIIEARREQVENPDYQADSTNWKASREFAEYTSSSIHTRDKQSFQYGRFEMRARFLTEDGLWPSFWTLGTSGQWPSNGEIDIFEFYGGEVHANVATGTESQWVARWDAESVPVSSFDGAAWGLGFHVWRLDWDADLISISLDGQVLNEARLDQMLNPDGKSPFRQPHYLLLSLAVGGTSGGDPSETPFPARYEVDYIRVFQRTSGD